MRSAARRKHKYEKKIRGLVLPGQAARYAPTAADRIHLEYCVKKEAITPMLQFSYVAFLEELIKHEASKRPEEAEGIYRKWANRGLDETTMHAVADCVGVTTLPAICPWAYKMKLTFTGNVSATNLDDFPVLVHLTNANFDFTHAKTNGEDIRFMDSDLCPSGGTPLKHEIECWDQAGEEAWVWVNVPRISTGIADFIYMYFDNAAAADGQDVNGTWNANFSSVIHMFDDPDNQHVSDSTGNGFNGTKVAPGAPGEVTDNICECQEFDGLDDYIEQPASLYPANNLTIEAWVKWGGTPTEAIVGLRADRIGELMIHTGAKFFWDLRCGAVWKDIFSDVAVGVSWKHVLVVKSSTAGMLMYVNGVLQADVDATATANADAQAYHNTIGALWTSVKEVFFEGRIEEVRVSNVVRSGDWAMANYLTQTDALITYGAEEGV